MRSPRIFASTLTASILACVMSTACLAQGEQIIIITTVPVQNTTTPAASSKQDEGSQYDVPVMYRYKNEKGVTAVASSLPEGAAARGYQVLNAESMMVLETVPPEPTTEERQRIMAEKKKLVSAAEQKKLDDKLLLRYSHINDIHTLKNRTMGEYVDKLKLLKSNLLALQQQLEAEQHNAARYERDGKAVPEATLKKIQDLHKEEENTQAQIRQREEDMAKENAVFDAEIAQYERILKERGLKQQ